MDNKKLSTVLTIIAFVIAAVGIVLSVLIMTGDDYFDPSYQALVLNTLNFTNVLLGIAAVIALGFGIYYFFTNIKKNVPLLIGVVVFGVLVVICYSLASDALQPSYADDITNTASKWSGAGLMVMYVLVAVTVVVAVVGEISRIFK